MKKIVLLILFIFLSLPVFAEEIIYLNEKWDKDASKILYEFALSEVNMTPKQASELFGFKLSDVRAVFYDLNTDGINEIIGFINAPSFYCVEGIRLFLLKKDNENYTNLTNKNFYPSSGIKILDSTSDNFFNLEIHFTKLQLKKELTLSVTRTYSAIAVMKYNKKYQQY